MPVINPFAELSNEDLEIVVQRSWSYEGFLPTKDELEGSLEFARSKEFGEPWEDTVDLLQNALDDPYYDGEHPLTETLLKMRRACDSGWDHLGVAFV